MTDSKATRASEKRAKVWVLDANQARADELCRRLRYLGYDPVRPEQATCDSLSSRSGTTGVAIILGEADEPDTARLLHDLANRQPLLPVLMLDRHDSPRDSASTIDSILAGRPVWTLDLPIRKGQLIKLLRRAERCDGKERRQQITGTSRPIREIRTLIEKVAEFDTNVLITGESGTGKELVARTIHDLSDRAQQPFVPLNCGAIPAELLESELFGHEKGAFTGAISNRIGRFELAEGGTLFLDEIGDMSADMQVKLLRVLQERTFERVGSNDSRPCNVRIVAATHRNLATTSQSGEFREDLYYRLSVFPIEMPPLYKRASDLPLLLDELLVQHDGANAGKRRFNAAAMAALAQYPWPGNIRELSNLVERLAILYPSGEIGLDELPAKYREGVDADATRQISQAEPADQAISLGDQSLKQHLQEIEVNLISQAMLESDGVVASAARLLNLRRTTLCEKLAKYELA